MTSHDPRTGSGHGPAIMGLDRFHAMVEAYGGRPEHWPAAERAAALALLAVSAEARALRDEAVALDALLDRASVPAPSPALADRILAQAPVVASARPAPASAARAGPAVRLGRWLRLVLPEAADWRGAAALAASLLVGIAVGYLTPPADSAAGWTAAEQQAVDAFAFGALASEEPSL